MKEKLRVFLETDPEVFNGMPLGKGNADEGMLKVCLDVIEAIQAYDPERMIRLIRIDSSSGEEAFFGEIPAGFLADYACLNKFLEEVSQDEAI